MATAPAIVPSALAPTFAPPVAALPVALPLTAELARVSAGTAITAPVASVAIAV